MEFINLEKIVDIYLGITHTPEYVSVGVPFLSVKDISKGKIDFSNCKYISVEEFNSFPKGAKPQKGDILFCRVGTIGKPIIIPDDVPQFGSFVSLGFLRLKTKNWNPQFIKYWMESDLFWKQVKQNTKGASQVNLNTNWLKKFIIPEFSIEIQNEIVEELNKITNLINLSQVNLNNYDAIVKSQFIEMFGDPIDNDKNWDTEQIQNVISINKYKGNVELLNGKVWLLNLDMIESNSGNILNYIYENEENIPSSTIKFNNKSVLYSKLRPYLNKVVIPNQSGYATSELISMVPNDLINKYFLANLLRYESFVNFANGTAYGAKMPRASVDEIKKFQLILPPIELQNKFADFVQQIDKSKDVIQKQIRLLEEMLETKMKEYFGD